MLDVIPGVGRSEYNHGINSDAQKNARRLCLSLCAKINMSIKAKLEEKFLRSQRPIARWVNVIAVLVMSVLSISCYFVIDNFLCKGGACEKLKVMSLAITFSPMFIVYGVIGLYVANYIRVKEDIRVAESDSMALITSLGALFAVLLAMGIWREVGLIA